MAESLISTLCKAVRDKLIEEKGLLLGVPEEAQKMEKNLKRIQHVLKAAAKKEEIEADVKLWVRELQDVAYDIEDLLDNWSIAQLQGNKPYNEKGEIEIGRMASVAVGPWGGPGGQIWNDGSYHGIKEVKIVYGGCIDSISVLYDHCGETVRTKHGGGGGYQVAEIKLNFPDEYLASVTGYVSSYGGYKVIGSLTFKSSRRTFGPYGEETGTPFSLPIDEGQIVGFRGRSGAYLDALGFNLSPLQSIRTKIL